MRIEPNGIRDNKKRMRTEKKPAIQPNVRCHKKLYSKSNNKKKTRKKEHEKERANKSNSENGEHTKIPFNVEKFIIIASTTI